ncbi:MAG: hypothetical protein ACTHU0_16905 [Kofleriaceae bacterium]
MKVAIGLALLAAHVAAFVALVRGCHGTELAVELRAPLAAPTASLDGTVPAPLADRVVSQLDDGAPGLVRRTWAVRYRGGYERRVGAAQLVGPFQDPAARACTGRIVVGQRLLDDGRASPGTIAHELAQLLDGELRGESVFGAGDYRRVEALTLRWAQLASHPQDRPLIGLAPHGYVRMTATLIFDRVDVPLVVALVPEPTPSALRFRIAARAELDFGNRALQWISNTVGADKLVTRLARRHLDDSLITALAPPPPFELPDGQRLGFAYCDGPPEIVDGASGALPFAVLIGRVDRDPAILPPRRGPAPHAPIARDAAVAIDLDLDALNALLFELWRSGFLDRRLADAGLDRRFNADPTVTELLSLRISPPRLALPPVLSSAGDRLRLAAEARVSLADGPTTTTGRVWGGLAFRFGGAVDQPASVELDELELSCERGADTLVPCYADLVAAMRDRGSELHGELTRSFAALLAEIFVDRQVGAEGLPAELVIRSARPALVGTPHNASLHLDLDASVARPKRAE